GRRGVYVQDLYVAPSERGTGLGRKLMAETARVAAEQGATYLRLSVDRSNESAQAFYNGIGLHPARNELIFKVTGKDFQSLINKGGLRL
ncbi:MAG TPA: GNAT family N-acetyltransferase, partial [Xanthomonadales bacterium]|nr:GNAT family N-acetyltransferase [Xanthomonadales bacterium]